MVVVVILTKPQVGVLVADEEDGERDTLMFAGQLVGGVNLVVASPAQQSTLASAPSLVFIVDYFQPFDFIFDTCPSSG